MKSLGWQVKFDGNANKDEDFQWVVTDNEGDEYDWFDTEADARECCIRKSTEEACERLAERISDAVGSCEELDVLKKIAKMLGCD